ncbi:MAG: TetR family transcriptional regulator [Acetobacteraceae bacterium]|nr:TetR family transcriptional regulator [Acetobacteraceae bacterium]
MGSAVSAPIVGIRDEVAALKRERTVEIAAELFYERGYGNTTLDAIAERMNVTKPFIYAHFTSKAELLAEICSRGIASALDALEGVLTSFSGTPRQRLQEVGRRFVASVLQSQRYIAIFAREEKNLAPGDFRRISEMRRTFDHKLVRLLDEGVASGDFDIADTRMTALAIGGMVSWAYVWYRASGRLTLEQTSDALTQLILKVAGASEPAPAAAPPRRGPGRRAKSR